MKLTIQPNENKSFSLRIPRNSVAKSLAKGLDAKQVGMSRKEITDIFKAELEKMQEKHPEMPIIEVKDEEGIRVTLGF